MDTYNSTCPKFLPFWFLYSRHCIQHSRFTKQDGWRLRDLSLDLDGNIAITCSHEKTNQTSIDVYSVRNSDSRNKPKIFYSKEFEKYVSEDGWKYWGRYVSFVDSYGDNSGLVLATGHGDKLELFDVIQDRVLKSRKVKLVNHGWIKCLSVRERREIFIGFWQSNKVTVYDVIDLNEIKSIILQGIQDGDYPDDMTVIGQQIFLFISNTNTEIERSLIFEEINGTILSEFTKPASHLCFMRSICVNVQLGVCAVVWGNTYLPTIEDKEKIIFYSLLSENIPSFLIVEIESGVGRIRISDRGDRMVTGNYRTGELKVYDMEEMFTYGHLKKILFSLLQRDDCFKLSNYFSISKVQSEPIFSSFTPKKALFLALEEKGVMHPSNVETLVQAFAQLDINPSCYHAASFFQKTRRQATSYGTFLATLSAHLTTSLPGDLCGFFNISDEKKKTISSSQNPGLSLLLALDEMGVIKPSEVGVLEQPLAGFRLVQAVAKIHEYQSIVEEEITFMQAGADLTTDGRNKQIIERLQKKMKIWYETITPVPWKKSCRWKSTELFVGSGLILTNSKTKRSLINVDEECKVEYTEVFSHERLKSEMRIILEGDPGSGKTMISSQLAYDWCQGKLSKLDALILMPLKLVGKMTLVDAIKKVYFTGYDSISVDDIEQFLSHDSMQKCILLDGLEEYTGHNARSTGESSEVMKIMLKVKYPTCKVILTSRSDYGHNLPAYPMLKIGQFSETERNNYIEKVFTDDEDKQKEVKKVIRDTPFILDVCSVPLLFVLAVHNIDSMGVLQEIHLDKVSPFMENMIKTLCLSSEIPVGETSSLEQLAFNGLCQGQQTLSWEKSIVDKNIANIRQLLDTGLLVVEEDVTVGASKEFQREATKSENVHEEVLSQEGRKNAAEEFEGDKAISNTTPHFLSQGAGRESSEVVENVRGTQKTDIRDKPSDSETQKTNEESTTGDSVVKNVHMRVKFLHKLIQEWFAAKHLSSVIETAKNENARRERLWKMLPQISPVDLHYVLRFTCFLCPSSCHLIFEFLLETYCLADGHLPEYIVNCICLCFAEYSGAWGFRIKDVMTKICQGIITIRLEDSRLIQQSKSALIKFASMKGIPVKGVRLIDVVQSVDKDSLQLSSGAVFSEFHTLEMIDVSRWDQVLEREDYCDLLKHILFTPSIKKACLYFPSEPPNIDMEMLGNMHAGNVSVDWIVGPRVIHRLDTRKGSWTMTFNKQHAAFFDSTQSKANEEFQRSNTLKVEKTISMDGGYLRIPNTAISVMFPPNALPPNTKQCLIQMRIIPRDASYVTSPSFASNSSVIVELLPNNLNLQCPVKLILPHCLQLKKDVERKAKVIVSHHHADTDPNWEEMVDQTYHLDDTTCTIWLKRFCWVTFLIDDKLVEGKRIKLYTAAKRLVLGDKIAETEFGYHLNLPGEPEILRLNKDLILSQRKPFLFLREGNQPLSVLLQRVIPSNWRDVTPEQNPKEIPFRSVASSIEYSCPFVLQQDTRSRDIPLCLFVASQCGFSEILNVRPEVDTSALDRYPEK